MNYGEYLDMQIQRAIKDVEDMEKQGDIKVVIRPNSKEARERSEQTGDTFIARYIGAKDQMTDLYIDCEGLPVHDPIK